MGTKSLLIIYHKGKHYISHHSSHGGHPSTQGPILTTFLRSPTNIANLKSALDTPAIIKVADALFLEEADRANHIGLQAYKLMHETATDAATDAGVDFLSRLPPYSPQWPGLCRRSGAAILYLIANASSADPLVMRDCYDVPASAREWAYVVDLDAGCLEVYGGCYPPGSMRVPLEGDRFARRDAFPWPVLVASWPFGEMPDEAVFGMEWEAGLGEAREAREVREAMEAMEEGDEGVGFWVLA